MKSVESGDAGTWICQEAGTRKNVTTHLIVVGMCNALPTFR